MLKIDGKLCWSPLHPFAYGKKLDDGRYFSHIGVVINRAFGLSEPSKFVLEINPNYVHHQGLYQWNLAWLVTPTADALPDAVKTAKSTFDIYDTPGSRSPAEYGEIINLADQYASDLYLPPTRFLTRMKNIGYKELFGISLETLMERAVWAEAQGGADIVAPETKIEVAQESMVRTAGNVIHVQFGRKVA